MRGDRDEKAWAFESAVEKALWWMLRSTLGRALRLMPLAGQQDIQDYVIRRRGHIGDRRDSLHERPNL